MLVNGAALSAQDMPDPAMMHGLPLPAPELAAGTVTVRVVRESLANNVPGQEVRLTVGGTTRTGTTDESGRAEFTALPGGEAVASATVDGETLTSQPFAVPTSGGVRVALVAGLAKAAERRQQEEAAAAAAPAVKGAVVIGGESRIVMEYSNDSLFAFYILEIVNNARARVDIGGPLIIDLPSGIGGAQLMMPGTTPAASINGSRVTVQGPFASGVTPVQVQFAVRYSSPERIVEQTFPVALERVVVGVEKVGSLALSSPQFSSVTELPTENGPYVLGQGAALAAGTPLVVTLSNLPLHSRAPRYIALGLAIAIVAAGIWLAATARASGTDRETLLARRDSLLGELTQLEARHRAGTLADDKYETRRRRLYGQLEQIYGELDDAGIGPQGGGGDIAHAAR